MQRFTSQPRAKWQQTVESQGLVFHTPEAQTYWDESAYYRFTSREIDEIEKATHALDRMCLAAVEHVIQNRLFDRFHVPPQYHDFLVRSWERDEITLVGRFDLAYNGARPPKLLEYNADTPTSLVEASVIQWQWKQDFAAGRSGGGGLDQFNGIHERLIEAWKLLPADETVYFTAMTENLEDFVTITYLRDTAMQAGLATEFIDIAAIGWDSGRGIFVDDSARPIRRCCKLYPWEWMLGETFGQNLVTDAVAWLEAPWKMILSNKQILVLLSEMFPQSPYILHASDQPAGDSFVKKPMLSREGANVMIVRTGQTLAETDGGYGDQPVIYQEYFPLPEFDGNHPVIGSWMVNGNAAGMGIREDAGLVTGNASRFVPHVIEG